MRAISNNYHVSIPSFPEEILTKHFFISIARTLNCSAITTGLGVSTRSAFLTCTVITVTYLRACAEGPSILISSNSESVSLSCSTDSCKPAGRKISIIWFVRGKDLTRHKYLSKSIIFLSFCIVKQNSNVKVET